MKSLPEQWTVARLEDLSAVTMGQSPPSSTYNESGNGLPFFQGKAEFTDLYPVAEKWCSAPTKIAAPGDILLSVRAPVGPTNVADTKSAIGRGLAALSPKPGVNQKYLLYALRYGEGKLANLGTGSTFTAVSGNVVRNFSVPLAPSNEQVRIAGKLDELLSGVDAGAEALERARTNLKRYRVAVLKAAVEGRLTEKWRAAHPDVEPASKLLERILAERRKKWEEAQFKKYADKGQTPPKGWKDKYSEPVGPEAAGVPELPEGWCWATVDQIAEIQGGIQKQPSRAPKKNSYPYLRVGNVLRNRLDLERIERFELFEGELERLRLAPGDLLIVEGNGSRSEIGRSALWRGAIENCVHQNHIIRVRSSLVRPEYLNAYWNSSPGAARVMNLAASTSGLYTLSVGKVSSLVVPVPPLREQDALLGELDVRWPLIERQEESILNTSFRSARLRQAILRCAFEGKLVPQDWKDEPASELLARIRAEREAGKGLIGNGKGSIKIRKKIRNK